ncbi:MAG: 4Fe-4S binding protein [Desulfobacteraceae bacterium]
MDLKSEAVSWLEQGRVDVLLAYKEVDGHPIPFCFEKERPEEARDLIAGEARYPLEKMAERIAGAHPDLVIGILARDCNQRALNVLALWNRLDPEKVHPLPLGCCPSGLKEHSDCTYLEPRKTGFYKRQAGIDGNLDLEALESYEPGERFDRWMYEFQKCIKCYGCRNICPVCFCEECSLEHPDLVETGAVPPEIPLFHLVRAVHMAGRCIDCGLCEDACPMDIPLRTLYRKVNDIVKDVFDYRAGESDEASPFSEIGGEVTLEPRPMAGAA